MVIKIVLVLAAIIAVGAVIYYFLQPSEKAIPDPRADLPQNPALKAHNFQFVMAYLLGCADFVDHKEGAFLLVSDLATVAKKNSEEFGFKECSKAIDIAYYNDKIKLILSDVAPVDGSQNKVGNLALYWGSDCVLKTRTETIETPHGLQYRAWIDDEAVSLFKDGQWFPDLNRLVTDMIENEKAKQSSSNMLLGAATGAALGSELGDFDD